MSFAVPCHPPRRGHGIRECAEKERGKVFESENSFALSRKSGEEGEEGADFGGSVGLIRENLSRLRHSASV